MEREGSRGGESEAKALAGAGRGAVRCARGGTADVMPPQREAGANATRAWELPKQRCGACARPARGRGGRWRVPERRRGRARASEG